MTILGLALEDAGEVTVEAEGASSSATLRVRGKLGVDKLACSSIQHVPLTQELMRQTHIAYLFPVSLVGLRRHELGQLDSR